MAEKFSVLYAFKGGNDGAKPVSRLLEDGSGNFFGTASEGGANGDGTVFELTAAGTVKVLHSFDFADGADPVAGLVSDNSGNLYGTTQNNGPSGFGTVFQLKQNGTITTLHGFSNSNDGANPIAPLTWDGKFLYGTTYDGGQYGSGTVFKLKPDGAGYKLVDTFGGADHAGFPYVGLVADAAGNLYGATSTGGTNHCGMVFKLSQGGEEQQVYSFGCGADGSFPRDLIMDGEGNIFGTTSEGGGNCGCGTVYEISTAGTETTLYTFTGARDGGHPDAGLVLDSQGALYGTTATGGEVTGDCSFGCGTIFRLSQDGKEKVFHTFLDGKDGAYPEAVLTLAADGRVYGTASSGGAHGAGTIFAVSP